jgi:hypothetical protein
MLLRQTPLQIASKANALESRLRPRWNTERSSLAVHELRGWLVLHSTESKANRGGR